MLPMKATHWQKKARAQPPEPRVEDCKRQVEAGIFLGRRWMAIRRDRRVLAPPRADQFAPPSPFSSFMHITVGSLEVAVLGPRLADSLLHQGLELALALLWASTPAFHCLITAYARDDTADHCALLLLSMVQQPAP